MSTQNEDNKKLPDDFNIRELAVGVREEKQIQFSRNVSSQQQQQQILIQVQTTPMSQMPLQTIEEIKQQTNKKTTYDNENERDRFGWMAFDEIQLPYIRRHGEKYCAIQMVELKILYKYSSIFYKDIYNSAYVHAFHITEPECRLFNEINHKHCESQYKLFTVEDLVIRLSDVEQIHQFLNVCSKKLSMGNKEPGDKCGFIRINKEFIIAYGVRGGRQFVPLFYFDGDIDNLKQKIEYFSGFDLWYLKFCCKVQGLQNEVFAGDKLAVINLSDIMDCFPVGTQFEDYWPNKIDIKRPFVTLITIKPNKISTQYQENHQQLQ